MENERRFVEITGDFPDNLHGNNVGTFDLSLDADGWSAIELFLNELYSLGVRKISQINISEPIHFAATTKYPRNGGVITEETEDDNA